MMLVEWERAVKEAEEDFQNTVRVQTPFVGRTMWLTGAILQYGAYQVFEVAGVFYVSDALKVVPGINGPNRHRVLVDWINKNTTRFGNALEAVAEAKRLANDRAITELTVELNPWRGR